MTKDKVIELVNKAIPYPNQIDWTVLNKDDQVRFRWRSCTFRVAIPYLMVESVEEGFLVSDDTAILCEALLKRTAELP